MNNKMLVIMGVVLWAIIFTTGCNKDIGNQKEVINTESKEVNDMHLEQIGDEKDVSDYFPHQEMIKVFSGGFENGGFIHLIDVFKDDKFKVKYFNGIGAESVFQVSEEQVDVFKSGELDPSTIFDDNTINDTMGDGQIVLKEPIKKGTRWSHGTEKYCEITDIDKEIETPIGTYKAVEVTYYKDGILTGKTYYAEGIGKIKLEYISDSIVLYEECIKNIYYDLNDYNSVESLYRLLE